MKPNGGGKVPPKIEEKIKKDFGTIEKFREEFINSWSNSAKIWMVLVINKKKEN